MTSRPALHRSLTFWAGLLVILFLGLAWHDSYTRTSGLLWREYTVASTNRGLHLGRQTGETTPLDLWWRTPASHHDTTQFFPLPYLLRPQPGQIFPTQGFGTTPGFEQFLVNLRPPGSWTLFLPYWFLLLAHLTLWANLLLHRARRRPKAKNTNPTTPP